MTSITKTEIDLIRSKENEEELVALIKIAKKKLTTSRDEIIALKRNKKTIERAYKILKMSNDRQQENCKHYHKVIDWQSH